MSGLARSVRVLVIGKLLVLASHPVWVLALIMDQVFISHSSKDRSFVESEIVPLLRRNSVKPWYSFDEIPTAIRWDTTILRALKLSKWFLVVLTPEAVDSDWVQAEVHWAVENRKDHLVPVILRECDVAALHLQLPRYQHVDFRDDLYTARRRLLAVWGITLHAPTSLEVCLSVTGRWAERSGKLTVYVEETCIIGRSPDAGIYLRNISVSRNHALLKVRNQEGQKSLWLADLGAMNRTLLNGVLVTELMAVAEGDMLAIGQVTLQIERIRDPEMSQLQDAGGA